MSLLDSIIDDTREKYNLGDKAETLLSALLNLMTNPEKGGFAGFVSRFRAAGLDTIINSWITTGDNTPISRRQLESALGPETLELLAVQTGIERETAIDATAYMLPPIIDILTPDGEVPAERDLLSRIGRHLTESEIVLEGGVIPHLSPAEFIDRLDPGTAYDPDEELAPTDEFENPVLSWLMPLALLAFLVVLGFWFCGNSTPVSTGPVNTPPTNSGALNAAPANTNPANATVSR